MEISVSPGISKLFSSTPSFLRLLSSYFYLHRDQMAMGKGRNNEAILLRVGVLLLLFLVIHCEAKVYNVRWTPMAAQWAKGKEFQAGDQIVFQYKPGSHNVVLVNADGYTSCTAKKGSKVYKSGNDTVTLQKGSNYFICTFPGHCKGGLKLNITTA